MQLRLLPRILPALLLLSLCVSGWLEKIYHHAGGNWLQKQALVHIDASIEHARSLLGPLALARGGADVVEGSTAVVEWGDIAQPALDYLTLAWKALLTAMVVLLTLKAFWQALAGLAVWLFFGAILCWLPSLIRTSWKDGIGLGFVARARTLAVRLTLAGVLLWFALPLGMWLVGIATERVQVPLRKQASEGFDHAGQVFGLDAVMKADGLLDRTGALHNKMNEVTNYFKEGGLGELGSSVVALVVIHVLDILLLPAVLAWLCWIFLRDRRRAIRK